jgi:hypothetical protein
MGKLTIMGKLTEPSLFFFELNLGIESACGSEEHGKILD